MLAAVIISPSLSLSDSLCSLSLSLSLYHIWQPQQAQTNSAKRISCHHSRRRERSGSGGTGDDGMGRQFDQHTKKIFVAIGFHTHCQSSAKRQPPLLSSTVATAQSLLPPKPAASLPYRAKSCAIRVRSSLVFGLPSRSHTLSCFFSVFFVFVAHVFDCQHSLTNNNCARVRVPTDTCVRVWQMVLLRKLSFCSILFCVGRDPNQHTPQSLLVNLLANLLLACTHTHPTLQRVITT